MKSICAAASTTCATKWTARGIEHVTNRWPSACPITGHKIAYTFRVVGGGHSRSLCHVLTMTIYEKKPTPSKAFNQTKTHHGIAWPAGCDVMGLGDICFSSTCDWALDVARIQPAKNGALPVARAEWDGKHASRARATAFVPAHRMPVAPFNSACNSLQGVSLADMLLLSLGWNFFNLTNRSRVGSIRGIFSVGERIKHFIYTWEFPLKEQLMRSARNHWDNSFLPVWFHFQWVEKDYLIGLIWPRDLFSASSYSGCSTCRMGRRRNFLCAEYSDQNGWGYRHRFVSRNFVILSAWTQCCRNSIFLTVDYKISTGIVIHRNMPISYNNWAEWLSRFWRTSCRLHVANNRSRPGFIGGGNSFSPSWFYLLP